MNKKAFTLVELLAVIAVLAILVIIALPNVISLFNESKKNTFINEVREVYKSSQQQWVMDSITDSNEKIYSKCTDGCSNPLKLTGRGEFEYYIKFNESGEIIEYAATDETYQYYYNGEGLEIDKIKEVTEVSEIENEEDVVAISGEGVTVSNNGETNPTIFTYTISDNEVTITGAHILEIVDSNKCINYLTNINLSLCTTISTICNATSETYGTCAGSVRQILLANVPESDYESAGLKVENYKNLKIPNKIEGYPVTSISGDFRSIGITSLYIPKTVKSISGYTFNGNKLKTVDIPEGIKTIGAFSFADNQLTSVKIPSTLETIDYYAFSDNQLSSISLPNGLKKVGSSAFLNNQLTSLTIPNSVTTIDPGAFNNNKLPDAEAFIYKRTDTNNDGIAEIDNTTIIGYAGANKNVVIPSGVTTIANYGMQNCQIKTLEIPASVNSLNNYAFSNNQLTSVRIIGKTSSSNFSTYGSSLWGWDSNVTCTKGNTSNVTNGCITWDDNR